MTRNGGERKAQQPRPVSLADVARRAGVSVATASRVASGSSYAVSPERFERVEKAILELGYTPNVLARALARDESLAIGVIVGDITDPYFGEVTRGIEDYARRAGYLTILCNADRNASVEKAYVDMLRQQRAAGIVLAGGGFVDQAQQVGLAACVEQAVGEGARVIAIADRALDGVPVISVDNEAMLADLTDYVASLGHERIAFVAAPPGFTTGDQRLAGFQFSMRRLRLDPTLIYAGGFDYAWGRRAALRILKDGLPDAIIAFNDESALGVLMALREAGVRVPEDVSVAGVDDTRDAQFVGLTSVAVPMYELGMIAARRIVEPGAGQPEMRTTLPHRLAPRLTTSRRP